MNLAVSFYQQPLDEMLPLSGVLMRLALSGVLALLLLLLVDWRHASGQT